MENINQLVLYFNKFVNNKVSYFLVFLIIITLILNILLIIYNIYSGHILCIRLYEENILLYSDLNLFKYNIIQTLFKKNYYISNILITFIGFVSMITIYLSNQP